jgi:hypothetical protein
MAAEACCIDPVDRRPRLNFDAAVRAGTAASGVTMPLMALLQPLVDPLGGVLRAPAAIAAASWLLPRTGKP